MEQYRIKTIVNYLKNRITLSNEIVKSLNKKTISLDDLNSGIRQPKSLVSTKRDINLVSLTNEEIDEFIGMVELLLNRYEININSNNVSLITYTNYIIDQLIDCLEADTNFVAKDLISGIINRFKTLNYNGLPSYGINPNIQGNIEVTDKKISIINKDLKRNINNEEDAILFGLSLKHRNSEILARDLFVASVDGSLCIVVPTEYYFYNILTDNMYGLSEVNNIRHLNEYLESQDLELMTNGYYTLERLTKILGHINRLNRMSKEEKTSYLNLSIQGSLYLTEYISNNTGINNVELDETRIYLQKYFYDRLVRKGKTDLRILPELDHGHPLDRALAYGNIKPSRCDINMFVQMDDHSLSTSIGYFTKRGLKYEDSVVNFETGYQYKK